MKILSVNNTADLYGSSRCMERVFGRFALEGHEVHAVLPEPGPLVDLLEAKGVIVHIHRGISIFERKHLRSVGSALKFLLFFPVSVLRLAFLAIRYRIDVFHTNSVVLTSPAVAALLTGRPHVWHIREMLDEFGGLWKPYQRFVSMFSTSIVAISECTRDQFAPSLRGKVRVIYDGLDESVAKVTPANRDAFRRGFPADKLLVGVVGRIKWLRKGQEILVRAAALLKDRHPEVQYVFVGSAAPGNEEHEVRLRELISSSGLDKDITLVGDTDDPLSVFAALDIAVVPPVRPEAFGCVVIEAMSAGTPVVGSRGGGIAEQIVDGVSGFLFTPGDERALADALDRLLSDPALRERMAAEGLRRVRDDFSLETTYRSMAALFEQVTGTGLHVPLQRSPFPEP
jgi:glycosyltransferase involved in cell wall biosynthesis